MVDYLQGLGFSGPEQRDVASIEELLARCNSRYYSDGLASLRSIPSASIDVLWSHAVLEHVRKGEFSDTLCELRRIVRSDGVCSHRVDLKDHLGHALNHLRFSNRVWESDFISSSGFYTNRIRFSRMLQMMEEAGFETHVVKVEKWPELPTPRVRLDSEFRPLSEDELLVSGFDVILKPR
jgi:hypothetical protein